MALSPGSPIRTLEDDFPLGAGGMGEVYRLRNTRLGRVVAIKILFTHLSQNTEVLQRFEREARAISSLSHPHICHLNEVGRHDGIPLIDSFSVRVMCA
jgi:eukaryotic-like serine/threonine-protein kinase